MINKSINILFIVFTLFVFSKGLFAQSLTFCESVDNNGNPNSPSTVFDIGNNGGYLDMLVNIPFDLNCRSVRYEVYRVDSYGSEVYNTTIYQDTQRDWRWFWKEITFYDAGKYNVYVYDSNDYLLTSGSVQIQFR